MEHIIRVKMTGYSDDLNADDLEKGFKQYVWVEEKTVSKIPSGDRVNTIHRKCKSMVIIPKTSMDQTLLLEVDQILVGSEFKPEAYYRIKSLFKVVNDGK